jgi:hypothetical protein
VRRSRAFLFVGLLAAGLVASATARATIVPQRGIAGVRLDMTQKQVRAKLGAPPRMRRFRNDFGPVTVFTYPRVVVTFQGHRSVTGLRTTSPLERTPGGVGVGSTEAQVKARVPSVKCRNEFGIRHCYRGFWLPGRVVTDFRIRKGRVSSVTVGYVID